MQQDIPLDRIDPTVVGDTPTSSAMALSLHDANRSRLSAARTAICLSAFVRRSPLVLLAPTA